MTCILFKKAKWLSLREAFKTNIKRSRFTHENFTFTCIRSKEFLPFGVNLFLDSTDI